MQLQLKTTCEPPQDMHKKGLKSARMSGGGAAPGREEPSGVKPDRQG